jgi:hypothetical protein
MNAFIVTDPVVGHVATLVDDPLITKLANRMVMAYLRQGMQVSFERDRGLRLAEQPGDPPAKKTIRRSATRRRVARATDEADQAGQAEPTKWAVGDRPFLKWIKLDAEQQVHLSQYAMQRGEVVEIVQGAGRGSRPTYRVRFNGDPEAIELKGNQLSRSAYIS